jgi:ABC-2 type transport system permease protein
MIAAILRAQLLSMRMGARRGAIFGLITGLLWYGFWCGAAVGMYNLAVYAGASVLRQALPTGLLLLLGYWQVVPIISASFGSALDMRKLLVYPVPHRKLFLVEVLLRLTTGAEMVLVAAGATAGLLRNPATGGWAAAPRILTPILTFLLFNLLLASGLRSLVERLLSRRRIREVLVILMLSVVTVPRLLILTGSRPKSFDGFGPLIHTSVLPWVAVADAMLGASGLRSLLIIAAWTLAAAWFGRTQFERNLRYDAVAAQATPLDRVPSTKPPWSDRFYRLPSLLFSDPLAVLIEKELRSLARTPRFRMVFVMGFTFGLMVWLPLMLGRQADRSGFIEENFLAMVCIYALTLLGQVTYWNCFGFDRSAVQIYFSAPQRVSVTLYAKNIASLIVIYVEVLVLTGLTWALHVGVGFGKVVETLVVVAVCSLYMLAFGNISSVHYPRALMPERVSQGGASSRFQALVFILYPLALLPVLLAYLARYAFASQTVFVVVLGFAAMLGGFLYGLAMESAVKTANTNRERILQDLSRGEGPVASN